MAELCDFPVHPYLGAQVKDAGLETDPARVQGERSLQVHPASSTVGSQKPPNLQGTGQN